MCSKPGYQMRVVLDSAHELSLFPARHDGTFDVVETAKAYVERRGDPCVRPRTRCAAGKKAYHTEGVANVVDHGRIGANQHSRQESQRQPMPDQI